jgi:membrane-bound ClpP family serine protease
MGVPRDLAPAGDRTLAGDRPPAGGAAGQANALAGASRVRHVGWAGFTVAVVVALGGVAFAAASVSPSGSLRWVTGALLLVLLAGTWLLCAHAGGHAWFVPVPALALAVLWAITISGHDASAAWWLLALSAAAAGTAVVVASVALSQRLRLASLAPPSLRGAEGKALTALDPVGVVRVAGETWTAESLSGSLPAGSAVHVARVDGVRLAVWSEAGAVPDAQSLQPGAVLPNEEEERHP